MLRKTLGWVDESGEPVREQHTVSYRELETTAGVSHSRLQEAIEEALKGKFIRCTQAAKIQSQGVRSQSAAYELSWDEDRYTDGLEDFHGFYLQPTYLDREDQTRIGRKNIPNIFFDYLIRNESRRVIRVVGTLLWYSIDWGKGGERKVSVRKALRDLVELTHLERSNVVRALNEAEKKGYVERIERGVFDLSGKKQSSATVYGIQWTSEYTYTYDGLPVEIAERSQKATQPNLVNAPKKPHGSFSGTLPKSFTENEAERSQKATRNAPKKPHEERSQKATIRITKNTNSKTLNSNSTEDSPDPETAAAVLELVEILFEAGFLKAETPAIIAEATAAGSPSGQTAKQVILSQVELLPSRTASKSKLGLLRSAIKGNWPAPEGIKKTKDVFSSPGKYFAASFYAGYHGNLDAPISDPSEQDSSAGQTFLEKLKTGEPSVENAGALGREFGAFVAKKHSEKRQSFPALVPAIRQFGDEFFRRLKSGLEEKFHSEVSKARSLHVEKSTGAYQEYLEKIFSRHEHENSLLFQEFFAEEEQSLEPIRKNRFGLNVEAAVRKFTSRENRLQRFETFIRISGFANDVLDFWAWDQKLNEEPFNQEEL